MTLSVSNLKKNDHPKLKLVADYLLYTVLPSLNIFFAAIQPVSPTFTIWAMAITNLLISLFKGLSKFSAEEAQS